MSADNAEIAWPFDWIPDLKATLMFLIQEGRVLLIRKKRGIGARKVNGPGGKLEPGETPLQCVCREVEEELGIRVLDPVQHGEIAFSFVCKSVPEILCSVFTATRFEGEVIETPEADPLWTDVGEVPYDLMWEDDRYWLPQLLSGAYIKGRFLFEGESLLYHDVRIQESAFSDFSL